MSTARRGHSSEFSPGIQRDLSFSRQAWIPDAVMAAIPWAWLAFLWIWGKYYGPNAAVPWQIGDRAAYDWCIQPFSWAACGALALYMLVTLILFRRNIVLKLVAVVSYLTVGLIAPTLAFA